MNKKKRTKEKNTWDLSPLLSSDNDPSIAKRRKLAKTETGKFVRKWEPREDYLKKPDILRKALDEYEKLLRTHGGGGDEMFYFHLRTAQEQNDPSLKAKIAKADEFSRDLSLSLQFFPIRIAKMSESKQKTFLKHQLLQKYRHYLSRLFEEAKYLLSENEEKILAKKSNPAHSAWEDMVSEFISIEEREVTGMNRKKEVKSFSEILGLISGKNKESRDSAARALHEILAKNAPVATREMNAILENKKIDDELRGFSRPDAARHLSDDIGTKAVDAMLDVVSANYALSHRFYKLKAKLMGVKELEYHERNVEYGKTNQKHTFNEAVKLVGRVFQNIDSEFADIYRRYLTNGQVDVYPRKGKRSGAFCTDHLARQPTYILLNHTDDLSSVLAIAHEFGHGINSALMRKKRHELDFGTPLSTAEVASTFMEDFVLEDILQSADSETKLSILMTKLNDDISTIFRQTACYRFEQELHKTFRENGYLSEEEVGALFQKHMKSYMGQGVLQSPGSENWWVYWGHIRVFFYVYSYASGLLISKAMQASFKEDTAFIENIKEFLSAGMSDSPKNIFLKMGIDIDDKKFWKKGIARVEQLLDETESLARELGKIK